ncbi:hypothetical protein [Secundilactobacillus oryzae]|uniref:hypothetical protein n=1 Tax=Secundilactobacillus oryzae TaxID=1202668 RepID=UPI0034E28C20
MNGKKCRKLISQLKKFLATKGVSHRLLSAIKKETGTPITVNGHPVEAGQMLAVGDVVTMTLPPEPADPNVPVSVEPLTLWRKRPIGWWLISLPD